MLVPTIATERLKLRAYELSDVPDLARLIGTREVAEDLLRVRYTYRVQDAREFVLSMEESTEARFAITLAKQSSLIGGIGLRIDPQHPRAELGYWLGMPYLGKGLCHGSGACHGRGRFRDLASASHLRVGIPGKHCFRQGARENRHETRGLPETARSEMGPIH